MCILKLKSCLFWLRPTDVCLWTAVIGGLVVECSARASVYVCVCVCVCVRDLQERGVQLTGCSAWTQGLYCKGSPAPLQQMRPMVSESTAPSH